MQTNSPITASEMERRWSVARGVMADLGLDALRARGFSAADITGRLAFAAGLLDSPQPASPQELLPLFSWDKVPTQDIPLPAGLFD